MEDVHLGVGCRVRFDVWVLFFRLFFHYSFTFLSFPPKPLGVIVFHSDFLFSLVCFLPLSLLFLCPFVYCVLLSLLSIWLFSHKLLFVGCFSEAMFF